MCYTNNVNEPIRQELKKVMKEKGLTQKALADRVGVTQSAVQQILSGYRVRPAPLFDRILETLGYEMVIKPKHPAPNPSEAEK